MQLVLKKIFWAWYPTIQVFTLAGNPTKIFYSVQKIKSAIEWCWVYIKGDFALGGISVLC